MKIISILLLFTLFCLHNSFTLSLSHSPSNQTDYLSLMDFKSMITNSDNVLGKKWTSTTLFCNWIGVTCNSQRQRVTALYLHNMSLEGEISPSIGNLTSLTTLVLSNNQLTGTIPRAVFNLPSLRRLFLANNNLFGSLSLLFNGENSSSISELEILDLGYNQLTGEISPAIRNLTSLTTLDLSMNLLTGSIPRAVFNLPSLRMLYLSHNILLGSLSQLLNGENNSSISELEILDLGSNLLTGEIPSGLCRFGQLNGLGLSWNSLAEKIPEDIDCLTNLEVLFMEGNIISGNIPPSLGNISTLQMLSCRENSIGGPIPPQLGKLINLQILSLGFNNLIGEIPRGIFNLSSLLLMNIVTNNLSGPIPSTVGLHLPNLEEIYLSDNKLEGEIPLGIFKSSLRVMDIGANYLSGHIPTGIGNLSRLIILNLEENSLTGTIPVELGNLNDLDLMDLSDNRLNGELPNKLCNLVNLRWMDVSRNDLSGPIPNCISKFTRITKLYLNQNRLTSPLPPGLWGLEKLFRLNLSGNLLQGELHADIRNLITIEMIDLSDNQFSGSIPNSLGELSNLWYINISSNLLNGSIPTSFGNLLSLKFLDLSQNHLSGSIPASLEKLSYLQYVNFSYNQLEGQIPPYGIFLNSSREDFEGNKGLCGMPSLGFPLCHTHTASQWSPGSRNFMLSIIIPVITSITLLIILLSIWIMRRRKAVRHENAELADRNGQKKISYHQILRGTDSFNEANVLGVGSFGSVFKAILADGELVAVKVLNLDGNEGKKRFDAECNVLKQIRHRNLVRIITTCSNDSLKAIILPYMPNGNLEAWLYKSGRVLNLQQRIEVMLDVAKAVEYLHHGNDFPVVHCDLKPSNVLLDDDMVAHVSDFGISKILGREITSVLTKTLGTIGYIAPEYGSTGIVSVSGDVYSYGIMLMEVLMRRRPTDELFTSNVSLRQWVEAAHPNSLNKVIDSNLFQDQENGFVQHHILIQSLVELSLHCSNEAPKERINMKDVVISLTKIKRELLK